MAWSFKSHFSGIERLDLPQTTNIMTGALIVSGGLGIEKNVFIGENTVIQGTMHTINTSTGALVVAGGVGIGQDLYVGETSYSKK